MPARARDALGHIGRRVVRAARAEPGRAFRGGDRQPPFVILGVDNGDAGGDSSAHLGGQVGFFQPPGDGPGNQRRRQLGACRQQPLAARSRPFAAGVVLFVEFTEYLGAHIVAPVVQFFFQRVFEYLALFLDDQDFLQAGGELARVLRIQGPDTADFYQPDTDLRTGGFIQPQVGQRLAGIKVSLAGGHDAEARARRIDDHAIEFVGARIGQCGIPLIVDQAGFLDQGRIGPAYVQAVGRQGEIVGNDNSGAIGIDIHRRGGFDDVGHAFHGDPQARIAAHGPTVQPVVQIFLDIGWIQDGYARRLQIVFGLMRDSGRFGGMVVSGQHQHAAVARGAGRIRMLEDIHGAVHARTFAVPHAENPVAGGVGIKGDLLRSPDGRRGKVFVKAGLEDNIVVAQMLLGFPQRLIQGA